MNQIDPVRNKETKILVIDDEAPIREVLCAALRDENYQVFSAQDGISGLKAIREIKPDIVFLDIWMPGAMDGLEVLKEAKVSNSEVDFVMISGHGTIETAVKATKLGAWDFIEKPLSMDKLFISIANIQSFQQEKQEKNVLLNRLRKNIALIGESPQMVQLKQLIARVAPTQAWVLISGEDGTGKELVAQNIHFMSSRAGRTFIDVNCAAIPEDLIESELFGFEKGAFTGAERAKKGKFDLANGGTLFLDEVSTLSLEIQAKLLKVMQEKTFQRQGGADTIQVDVRVIAATCKNLEVEVAEGRFRQDLYYKLNVVPFLVPPVNERTGDVPALVDHFSDLYSKGGGVIRKAFSEQALDLMIKHSWPGNVRELKNFIERVYILTPGEYVDVHDLRFAGLNLQSESSEASELSTFREARANFEKDYLIKKINENGGNISRTAEVIGLERSYLHRKIKAYGLDSQLNNQGN
jgi:two-component system, NtrC family, nitrogen regulation response regulator NtrX